MNDSGFSEEWAKGSAEYRRQHPLKPGASDEWKKMWMTGRGKEPLANLANALTTLREAPELGGILAYDEMAQTPMIKALPGQMGFDTRPLTDSDVSIIQEYIQRIGLQKLGKETCDQAVDVVCREYGFHPVRSYLDGLTWDGEHRLGGWLTYYLGVEASDYLEQIGEMFMIAMVARVFRPGCKCDYMLVLEGAQGTKKSSACAILADQWFSDHLPDLTIGKDVSQHIRGKWLVEIAELSSLSRTGSGPLRAFLTRQVERYRPSYGRHEVHEPRQCVFIGTTNESVYLKDNTGGRRFWPVKCGSIDLPALRHDRDQLFAEAVARYKAHIAWWPDSEFEAEYIKPQQETRYEPDAWQEPIADYLDTRSTVTIYDIARNALYIESSRLATRDTRRISTVLQRLNWKRGLQDSKGRIEWVRT
jgi:predicted P-loop ATPase